MKVLVSLCVSLISFSLLAAPAFAASTTTSAFGTATSTFVVQPLISTFPSSNSNNSSNSSTDSGGNSSSGIATAVLGVGALVGIAALINAIVAPATAANTAAIVATQTKGLSFGGRITVILPCLSLLGPSIWMAIAPAPATKQPFYIYTLATLAVKPIPTPPFFTPVPDLPPPNHPLQQILGVADIPYWCCLPGGVPTAPGLCAVPHPPWIIPGLPGQRIQWASQSPG